MNTHFNAFYFFLIRHERAEQLCITGQYIPPPSPKGREVTRIVVAL